MEEGMKDDANEWFEKHREDVEKEEKKKRKKEKLEKIKEE